MTPDEEAELRRRAAQKLADDIDRELYRRTHGSDEGYYNPVHHALECLQELEDALLAAGRVRQKMQRRQRWSLSPGTRTLLYGAHTFWLHPWFVAAAWIKLFGFPWDPRIWLAFIMHDWGYWGKPNLDGPEGEQHPEWCARVFTRWFGVEWGDFVRFHSRFLARQRGAEISRLGVADKFSIVLTPWWLYLPLVRATGEIREFQHAAKHQQDTGFIAHATTWRHDREWYAIFQRRMRDWTIEWLYA